MESIDLDGVADQVLRFGEPYDPDCVVAAAVLIGELVRRLNHASRTFVHPVTVDTVVHRMCRAIQGMPQLCDQLAASLTAVKDDPALASDDPTKGPSDLATLAAAQLGLAATLLAAPGNELAQAGASTSHLYERA
jgi:hypothetical protein